MGKVYLRHLGGTRMFICASCDTPLTNRNALVSTRFTGATGRAFLFNKVVNLKYSAVQDRIMLTGRHMVRDVSCVNCDAKLGWMYEFATEESQRYKEGHVILERALVTETEGFDETKPGIPSGPRSLLQALANGTVSNHNSQVNTPSGTQTLTLGSSTQPVGFTPAPIGSHAVQAAVAGSTNSSGMNSPVYIISAAPHITFR